MWLLFLMPSCVFALINIIKTFQNKNGKIYRFISLSSLIIALCFVCSLNNEWVVNEDWTALLDVSEQMTKNLWIISSSLILVNFISLYKEIKKDKY